MARIRDRVLFERHKRPQPPQQHVQPQSPRLQEHNTPARQLSQPTQSQQHMYQHTQQPQQHAHRPPQQFTVDAAAYCDNFVDGESSGGAANTRSGTDTLIADEPGIVIDLGSTSGASEAGRQH
eukprot:563180-Alexandrium_andersonii.AAC.1